MLRTFATLGLLLCAMPAMARAGESLSTAGLYSFSKGNLTGGVCEDRTCTQVRHDGLFHMTTNEEEKSSMVKYLGWYPIDDGTFNLSSNGETRGLGFVFDRQAQGTVPLFRYLDSQGSHFFTLNEQEGQNAVSKYGYTAEGICCYVAMPQLPGTHAIYRLFDSKSGLHVYTGNSDMKERLRWAYGYTLEGIEGYAWDSAATLPAQ